MESSLVLSILIVAVTVPAALACSGYYTEINSLKTCDGVDSILQFDNFSAELTEDCKVVPSGCLLTTKPFTTAKVTYKIVKDMVPYSGEKDGCASMGEAPEEAVVIMQLLGLPTACPVEESKVCGEEGKDVDVAKYKNYLPAAIGSYKGQVDIVHDSGVSCISFDMNVKSKGVMG